MYRFLVLLIFLFSKSFSQGDSLAVKVGSKAPSFILNLQENSIQSFTMPHMKRIVLLNFWSTNIKKCRQVNKHLNRLADRYKNTVYKNADGFEIIAIAVQTDRNTWSEAIKNDTLTNFTHGIALRGYNDDICRKYGVRHVPTQILIDESGIILAIDPRIMDIENILDDRKNFQPIRKDVIGTLAQSSDRNEPLKFARLYLLNYYGDSLEKTITSAKGGFIFSNVKLNQDFVLKLDNKIDINTTDPIALYTPTGEFLMDGRTKDKGFVFFISPRNSNKLIETDSNSTTNTLGQIDVIKHLTFFTDGKGLVPNDEKQLSGIISMLLKNRALKVELITHTDARTDKDYAMELTTNQANTIKNYFIKKGVAESRINAIPRGNSELRKICEGMTDCREEDHRLNRRVEFLLYKD
jgi:outer membrane protein OmpA-like peptidoglycan-associated protein/thiol-disulfide isomerase/thioredoxin